jgi:hypothetical protein
MGKKCGRPLTNGSGRRGMPRSAILNGPHTKRKTEEVHGAIHHCVIGDVGRMILGYSHRTGIPLSKLVIWKFDLRKAYGLLWYQSDQVCRLGVEVSLDSFFFFIGGVFGLTQMPGAFQCVTRAIVFELKRRLRGDMVEYVDDGICVCPDEWLEAEMKMVFKLLTGLFGPLALAMEKVEAGWCLDFIGYETSLANSYIAISRQNLLKSLYAYLNVDINQGILVPVKILQKLASPGSRVSGMCEAMKPFVTVIWKCFKERRYDVTVPISNAARAVLMLFRCLFVLQLLFGRKFSRPLTAFLIRKHT